MKIKSVYCSTFVAIAMLIITGCHRQDIQTLNIQVPGMKTDGCASLIYSTLQPLNHSIEGIVKVVTDVPARRVDVTYDSRKIAIKNIEYIITGIGFEANGFPPHPAAQEKLPVDCR